MENLKLNEILDTIANKSDLTSQDIPALDLYIDQIRTLFDENLKDNKRYSEDKLLTKTMINNYSKAGLIKPVKGKKYTKEQILQMLLVYNLKNTITMQEIKQVLSPVYESETSIEDIYNRFISIKQEQNTKLASFVQNIMNTHQLTMESETDCLLTIMSLSMISNQMTNIVESIIDSNYTKGK